MSHHSDFLIGSTFQSCSAIGILSITLPLYQLINDSDQAERRQDVYHLWIGIVRRISIVNGHSSSSGNIGPIRRTNDYSLMFNG